ncbi:M23 family metallopeptidase [Lutibacter sp. B2]|nr:M23 family metallopeptidase [Lutibacter sp. B2]
MRRKKEFYMVLFLGVFIIGASSIWVNQRMEKDSKEKGNIANEQSLEDQLAKYDDPVIFLEEDEIEKTEEITKKVEQVKKPIEEKQKSKEPVAKPKKSKTLVKKQEEPEGNEEATVAATSKSAIIMKQPIIGKIGMNYAENTLVYSKTLDQYTSHKGLDIIAPINTPVVAALSGKVIEVVTDSRLGITITMEHENDMITRYSNLSTAEMVAIGEEIEQGQPISGIGKTALFESGEEPHLHFEVLLDGKQIDPNTYLSGVDNTRTE